MYLELGTQLTTHEVARLLQVDPATVVNWTEQGDLRATRTIGGHRRIRVADLLDCVRQRGMALPDELRHLGRPSILIVDDNELFLRSMERRLRPYDIELHTANDGISGLMKIGELSPTLVLLDIHMPGMNGIEVCRRLRENPSTAGMKVVVITAQGDEVVKKEALEAGADLFLDKDFRIAVILDLLGIERGE